MVELSTSFGVLCRFTAIVAIDPRHPDRKPDPASLRRIVQPVEMVSRVMHIHAYRSVFSHEYGKNAPPDCFDMTPLCCEFGASASFDPMDAVRADALDILVKARPKSGGIGDIKAGRVRSLLKAVLALLRKLGACGAPRDMIESLATAYGRLYALPADRAAIAAMLDVLADIAGSSIPADRWWRALLVDRSTT